MTVSGDRLVGIAFIAIGAGAGFIAAAYGLGTLRDIGPGVFPLCLSFVIALLGVILVIWPADLAASKESLAALARPALFILTAVLLFALLLEPAGLLIASFVLVVTSGFADRGAQWLPVLGTGVGLTIFAWLVFVLGLRMPIPVFPSLG